MGHFESQQYRADLVKKIKQEPDKVKRKTILRSAKATDEYRKAETTKRREETRYFWGEFFGGDTNEVGEYKEPTLEERNKFKIRNERMSEIFENANFPWFVDGAVNISLYRGSQMRDHKDLDISVFREDLLKLEEFLFKQGFGIFIDYEENGRALTRRATKEELMALERPHLSICKLNTTGKRQKHSTEPFHFVDLHVHSKDTEGNVIINYTGTVLPKEFFEPIKKELSNGKQINLSHPAVVAYHKLHSGRPYDLTDLQRLRPYLKERDFTVLREALEKETKELKGKVREKLLEVWELLTPILENVRNQNIISERLWMHPDIKKLRKDPKTIEYVSSISRYILQNPRLSFEDFSAQSLSILKLQEQINQKLIVLRQLEKSSTNRS